MDQLYQLSRLSSERDPVVHLFGQYEKIHLPLASDKLKATRKRGQAIQNVSGDGDRPLEGLMIDFIPDIPQYILRIRFECGDEGRRRKALPWAESRLVTDHVDAHIFDSPYHCVWDGQLGSSSVDASIEITIRTCEHIDLKSNNTRANTSSPPSRSTSAERMLQNAKVRLLRK